MPRETFRTYLTIKEAAAFLGGSSATLRNWDPSGKLVPARHPLNGYRLYRREVLASLLAVVRVPRQPSGDGPREFRRWADE